MRRARLLSQDRLQLPILTECYKVAAYNAANKLASVRHAARAADPSVPAEPSAPVVVAGR
ncbi:MAG TPA: hypothetical protein VM783_07885 [Candidatus Acidoferrum sp.]|jgi:hypothetical protein|nr:hypothetical protein [Candidatus Acidoferrum sp.]